jgi:hypothetical protein
MLCGMELMQCLLVVSQTSRPRGVFVPPSHYMVVLVMLVSATQPYRCPEYAHSCYEWLLLGSKDPGLFFGQVPWGFVSRAATHHQWSFGFCSPLVFLSLHG